ncbi:Transglycosylase SLT domain protein [Sphingopyxis sp. LC81]|nr:lytic transglycosylase domain-containing protein [Sphingopyxis sp. SE2]KGB51926.1 Transglycosylase SLT domain protein [Sphingopyxis sp. LC81]
MKRKVMLASGLPFYALCTSVSANETSHRRAELIDFAKPPLPRGDAPQISSVISMDFGKKVDTVEPNPNIVLQLRTRAASSSPPNDRIRVPSWMQPERSIRSASMRHNQIELLGRCRPRPYLPSNILARDAERRRKLLYSLVREAACEAGIPVALMDALLMQESRYNPVAVSPKGAFGLGQLMPGTAKQLGVDRYSLRGNLRGTARYLGWQLREFGRVDLALAAYNAGPGRVRKGRRIPRIVETRNYVSKVLANWRVIESNYLPPASRQAPLPPRRVFGWETFRPEPESATTDDDA